MFFRSVIVALVPRLTDAHNQGGQAEVRRVTGLGVRIMLAISLPLAALMAVLGKPAAVAVFYRGSNSSLIEAGLLGTVLIVYSISLPGQALQRAALLARRSMRGSDTRTPLRNALYGLVSQPHPSARCSCCRSACTTSTPRSSERRARVLARSVRQRRTCLVSTHADGRQSHLRGVLRVRHQARLIASGLSAAAMIGASLDAQPRR